MSCKDKEKQLFMATSSAFEPTANEPSEDAESLSKKFKTSTGAAITMPAKTSRQPRARKSKRADAKIDKNTRERKRRKSIKARFDKLHELMVSRSYVIPDPMQVPPSKVSVLNNAISTLTRMTKEIEQLRQENAELEASLPSQKKVNIFISRLFYLALHSMLS